MQSAVVALKNSSVIGYSLEDCEPTPHWPPEPGNVEVFPASSHENQGIREDYKLLSVRYQFAGARERESTKFVFGALPSLTGAPHQKPAPRPKHLHRYISLFLRKTGMERRGGSVSEASDSGFRLRP